MDLVERREDELQALLVTFVKASAQKVKRSKIIWRVFWGTLLGVSVLVAFLMWGLMEKAEKEKQEVERVTNQLVQLLNDYGKEGMEGLMRKEGNSKSIKIIKSIIKHFKDSKNSEIKKTLLIAYEALGGNYLNQKKIYSCNRNV